MRYVCLWLLPAAAWAQFNTTLSPRTSAAFEEYLRGTEPQMQQRARYGQLRTGEVRVEPARGDGSSGVKDGLVHDWVAAAVVPGATVGQALAVLQDYPAYKRVYAPEVVDSRLLGRDGEQWSVYLRLVKKKVLTAVLNTEYNVTYRDVGQGRWAVTSRSTRIAEVEGGRELPLGTGHGFLWRLNAYWWIEPRAGGVYLECRSVSLSRDIPFGLGFAVGPFVKSLPRESLQATLEATARGLGQVVARAREEHPTVAQVEVRERGKRDGREIGGGHRQAEPAGEQAHPQQVRENRDHAVREMKAQQAGLAVAPRPARVPVEVVEQGGFDGQRRGQQIVQARARPQPQQQHLQRGSANADGVEAQPANHLVSSRYNCTVCLMVV